MAQLQVEPGFIIGSGDLSRRQNRPIVRLRGPGQHGHQPAIEKLVMQGMLSICKNR